MSFQMHISKFKRGNKVGIETLLKLFYSCLLIKLKYHIEVKYLKTNNLTR